VGGGVGTTSLMLGTVKYTAPQLINSLKGYRGDTGFTSDNVVVITIRLCIRLSNSNKIFFKVYTSF
jgi:hypothetical protein